MRHGIGGRMLSRNTDERRRLIMILTRFLFLHGSLKTTQAKAKAIQPSVEKLITKAKKGDNASLNEIRKQLADKASVDTLLAWAKSRFAKRSSGFTRIIKLGMRKGDGAEEVVLSFVDELPQVVKVAKSVEPKAKKVEDAEIVPAKEEKKKVTSTKKVAKK